jgi:predicted lipoprotein
MIFITSLLFFIGCNSSSENDLRRDLLLSWGVDVVVDKSNTFEDRSRILSESVSNYCQTLSEEDFRVLQTNWWEARTPWKELEVFRFGPYKEDQRLGPKIDFWPVRVDTIEEILAGDSELSQEALYNYGTSSKGFPVLDYLLFNADAKNRISTNARYCDYTNAVAGELTVRAGEFHDAWHPEEGNYVAQLTEAGYPSSSYPSLQHSVAEVVNRMGHTIENIRIDKIATPMGLEIGTTQPDKLESPYSKRSFQDIKDNLYGIRTIYYGAETPNALGLQDLLESRSLNYDSEFESLFQNAIDMIDAFDKPMTEVLEEDPQALILLSEELQKMQNLIQTDIVGGLSLWVSFNDADGD